MQMGIKIIKGGVIRGTTYSTGIITHYPDGYETYTWIKIIARNDEKALKKANKLIKKLNSQHYLIFYKLDAVIKDELFK